MVRKSALLAAAVMGVAAIAQAGAVGVFTENTGHATPSSFIAGSAPYGWLSPVGDTGKTWEIYRKRVSGGATTATNPDVSLSNDVGGEFAVIQNEYFGNNAKQLTDLGMIFGVANGTASQPLALQSYSNQGMEFRVGFMQKSKVGTGWLAGTFGDNRMGNMTTDSWGACQDPANANNGADTMFLKIAFTKEGALKANSGLYTHSGADMAGGERNYIITGTGSGLVGTGLQPMSWSITDAGSDQANFAFSWGGYSYNVSGVSLAGDLNTAGLPPTASPFAFTGTGGKFDLTDTVPFVYVGGEAWDTAGLNGAVGVPEPTALGAVILGAAAMLRRRRA